MWAAIRPLLLRFWKPIAVILLVLLALGGCYLKGSADKDQEWQARWTQRDLDDSTQKGIDNVAARIMNKAGPLNARRRSTMHKNGKPPRWLLLIGCAVLLTACKNSPPDTRPNWTPQNTPLILPLPSQAKQPDKGPECSPSCSEALQKKLNIMLNDLTKATTPG